jgi:SAM-dependent methyltransferase
MTTWSQVRLVPRLASLGLRKPRNPNTGWEHYWAGVQVTGATGDVLWDSGSDREMQGYLPLLAAHFDPALPIVDLGCGNGRFTRWLAPHFPFAVGLDLSEAAVRRARSESADLPHVAFRAVDVTAPGVGAALAAEFGEVNVFIRGVLHVLARAAQRRLADNVGPMLGERGRVLLAETDFPGSGLDYLVHLGATPGYLPGPLERAIRHLPKPGRFGAAQLHACFPDQDWQTLAHGKSVIEAVAMHGDTQPERIPGYLAVLANRNNGAAGLPR